MSWEPHFLESLSRPHLSTQISKIYWAFTPGRGLGIFAQLTNKKYYCTAEHDKSETDDLQSSYFIS